MLEEHSESEAISANATSMDYFPLWLPDRASVLQIRSSAIRELRATVDADPEHEVRGILLASISEEGVYLETCEAVHAVNEAGPPNPEYVERSLGDLITARQQDSVAGAPTPIGFFRTTTGSPVMSVSDYRVAKRYLRAPGSLFLIIQISPHIPWSASLFTWGNRTATKSMAHIMSFAWDEEVLAAGAADLSRARKLTSPPLLTSSLGSAAWLPSPAWLPNPASLLARSKGRIKNLVFAILVLIGMIGIGSMVYRVFQPENKVTVPESLNSDLALKVTRSGPDFEISWNQSCAAIQHASYGLLTIRDNQYTRVKEMNPDQLRGGRILYNPASKEPKFTLELKVDNQRTASDSVQVLQAGFGSESMPTSDPVPFGRLATPETFTARTEPPQGFIGQHQTSITTAKTVNDLTPKQRVVLSKFSPPVRPNNTPLNPIELTPPSIPREQLSTVPKPSSNSGLVAGAIPPLSPPTLGQPSSPVRSIGLPNTKDQLVITPGQSNRFVDPVSTDLPKLLEQSQKQGDVRPSRMAALTAGAQVVRQIQPQIPIPMRGLLSDQEIEIRVTINEKGRVVGTTVTSRVGQMVGLLVPSALEAAQQWIFKPAERGNEKVASDYAIKFVFAPVAPRKQ